MSAAVASSAEDEDRDDARVETTWGIDEASVAKYATLRLGVRRVKSGGGAPLGPGELCSVHLLNRDGEHVEDSLPQRRPTARAVACCDAHDDLEQPVVPAGELQTQTRCGGRELAHHHPLPGPACTCLRVRQRRRAGQPAEEG